MLTVQLRAIEGAGPKRPGLGTRASCVIGRIRRRGRSNLLAQALPYRLMAEPHLLGDLAQRQSRSGECAQFAQRRLWNTAPLYRVFASFGGMWYGDLAR